MKKAILFLSFIILLSACAKKVADRESLSPVRANQQTTEFVNQVNAWVGERELSEMSSEDFLRFIYSVNPNLDRDMIRELIACEKIGPGEKVSLRYHYFNEEGVCRMENAEGKFTKVNFKNEMVLEVIRPNEKNLWVAIVCLNGILDIDGQPTISGDASMSFTIGKGQGLSRYLADDYWAINVAEEFGLPLFRGNKQSSDNLITPNQARELAPDVDKIQITVFVKEGWTFVLSDGNWTLNGLNSSEFKAI